MSTLAWVLTTVLCVCLQLHYQMSKNSLLLTCVCSHLTNVFSSSFCRMKPLKSVCHSYRSQCGFRPSHLTPESSRCSHPASVCTLWTSHAHAGVRTRGQAQPWIIDEAAAGSAWPFLCSPHQNCLTVRIQIRTKHSRAGNLFFVPPAVCDSHYITPSFLT